MSHSVTKPIPHDSAHLHVSGSARYAVVSARDIPGSNDCSPVMGDDPVFVESTALYRGQSVFAVAASTLSAASVARTTSILRDRPVLLRRTKTAASTSTARPNTRQKCNTPSPRCWGWPTTR